MQYPFASIRIPEVKSEGGDLQIQTLSGNDVPSDLCERFLEFLSEFIRTHDFTSLSHLSKKFFKTAKEADERSFVDICHLAIEGVSYSCFLAEE
jgi:predicted N-acyltransferase